MYVNSSRLRELRLARQWSQEQLASVSGLNLRTIQRLESGAKISTESLRALAASLEVPAESLLVSSSETKPEPEPETRPEPEMRPELGKTALKAMREGVIAGLEFTGSTPRTDFWWFALGVVMFLAFAKLLSEALGPLPLQIASLAVLLPWVAACTRRLRDAGLSPWWQLISLVPVAGILVLLYLLTLPTKVAASQDATSN
ncbi:DUF805 domain-containing protein [Shewanella sp. JM162201]|uniref:DUF805 domain-containing protein n=1 Tax=Shewanella jiangmenensis TaxID=2837387 RepID=A0ABS5V0W9_9GAMM|nr:DUF805 domain-containing protein [Shewanella jiangmenensis]MBT1443411.1 DUF805 domain-containing protein [Shewanella jiangmenensis]